MVFEFNSSLNPRLENGIVVTGIATVDSLNVANHANNFQYYDFTWSSRLKYVLLVYFDPLYSIDIESKLQEYELAVVGLSNSVEYIPKPSVEMIPGEFLYSENIYHDEDTAWMIYDDNDDKRNWSIYDRFQWPNSSGGWTLDIVHTPLWEEYWGPFNATLVNELERPFPYGFALHGHSSLLHHLEDYNNTYKAWDYSTGTGTVSMLLDPTGYWTQHPDLINRWHPGYPTQYIHDGVVPPSSMTPEQYQAWHGNNYHVTVCAGALAAGIEDSNETSLTHMSSVGIAPSTMLIGRPTGVFDCLSYLHSHPLLIVNVITASYRINYDTLTENAFRVMIEDMGITIVKSRSYDQMNGTEARYGYIDGFIVVGDYRPDYRVKTIFCDGPPDGQTGNPNWNTPNDLNGYEEYYRVDINAPGWNVWVPDVYHTYESGFQQIGYALSFGSNTSIAGPQVAGVVSLIKSMYPWMTPAQVERQIKLGAHHLDDMIDANASYLPMTPPNFFGAGCLNAYGSLFLHGDFTRDFVFSNEANNTALIGRGSTLINSSMTVANGILRIEKDANVLFNNSTLILGDNVTVLFEKGAKLDLSPNSTLVVGNNVTFQTEYNETCQGLVIFGNNAQNVTFNNTIFINVPIEVNNTEAAYNGCTFTRSNVLHNNEPLSINYSDFEFSGLQAIQTIPDNYDMCWIRNTEVSNSTIAGIQITGYSDVKVENNNIHHNFSGIELYECTGGIVSDNEISFNGNGILLYHSKTDISGHNNITYNYSSSDYGDNRGGYGIDARHLTSWKLIGQNTYPIQVIHDNQREQILMQSNSIPSSMYYNKVDSSNHDNPYLRMWDTYIGAPHMINISNNNWSNDFVPTRDLSPENAFTYLPIWEPGIPLQVLEDEAFLLFEEAMSAADNMEYIIAEQKLKQIIAEYPETKVCIDAAKQLLIMVEKYNQNYEALELYYTTYPTLRNDPILVKMADYLANFCKMKSGDYPEAIQFFEDLILNPTSLPDSLFAVVDAGYAYLLMAQNSDKSSFIGELKWLKPVSVSAYLNNRNALINNRLSTTTENSQSTPGMPNAIRISNYPNPFNPDTTINFYLPVPGNVVLEVFNIKGQRIKTLINEHKEIGSHSVVWNGTDHIERSISSGVYFYRLSTGTNSIVRKMLLMK